MKLTNVHKQKLDKHLCLIEQTMIPYLIEKSKEGYYSREVEAYEYLVEKLTKILNKTKLCS